MKEQGTAARIADVAQRILVEQGAEAVSMRRVGEAVGVTAMAIYRHYPNREALLRAVATTSGRELAAEWARLPRSGTLEERIDVLLDGFLDFALGRPHLYTFLMSDAWARARRFPEDFREGQGPPFTVIVEVVEEGMRTGLLRRDDPLEVALTVTSSMQGLIQQYLSGRVAMDEAGFRALCHRCMRRIIDGLRV
ncbi:TetR/AcrR family transcriptional regulator [Nonomuraea sp. NEAU-A123]|uniref:TetR/AcrR family transcriptional regulator n=1 Tax=Nonomuraea sp. NEAU-A123 TaxID=2839649 RepID=UPI001BE40E11|nr:TetR/AcrR family transcriptional regulator [Nonomuraea sp. NEAU-A123]MBT2224353.1 TetR/AcrR family transcriptional regulator [Nonomuraea sp. NEAU-A123]